MLTIKKGGREYSVLEYEKEWVLVYTIGKHTGRYSVSKDLCPTFEALKNYMIESGDLS